MILPELRGGEKLRLTSGLVVEVIRDGSRAARLATAYDEPLYKLKFPARTEANGWRMPGIVGNQRYALEELAEMTEEVLP